MKEGKLVSRRKALNIVGLAPVPDGTRQTLLERMNSREFRTTVRHKKKAQELLADARACIRREDGDAQGQLAAAGRFLVYVTETAPVLLEIRGHAGRGLGSVQATVMGLLDTLASLAVKNPSREAYVAELLWRLTTNENRDIAKRAWLRLGDIARGSDDLQAMVRYYVHAEAWQPLGDAFADANDFDAALTYYKKSDNWQIVLAGAQRCMEAKLEDQALDLLETKREEVVYKGRISNKNYIRYYKLLLDLYLRRDRLEDAIAVLEGVSKWDPFRDNITRLARLREQLERRRKASASTSK
jgi:tetratricopeptide (TPR) repeat protein